MDAFTKPVHTLILDTGALIKNEPPISTLLSHSQALLTVPEILTEIKDAATRSRVQTTLLPFLQLRSPRPESVKFVADFARRTGDLAVLSRVDLLVVALGYEVECERNGGDWRLRRMPGQRGVNGRPPVKEGEARMEMEGGEQRDEVKVESEGDGVKVDEQEELAAQLADVKVSEGGEAPSNESSHPTQDSTGSLDGATEANAAESEESVSGTKVDSAQNSAESQENSSSDSEGWITPSNLRKKQAQDAGGSSTQAEEPKTMQAAILTTDFAMQNVIMQINLNLLSPSLTRVKHLKTFVLRCHACFQVCKDTSKQFCPKCGQPTLTRVSCSTSANGEFKLHLKRNMQWNHRGERYSVPKPVHGAANGRVKGGGKGGWGNELMLAEDQKEYQRAVKGEKKAKERSLMDEDYLPGILTGDRKGGGGRVKVGAGRNVNSRKR